MWLLENPVSATFLALLAACAVTVTFLAIKEHAFVGRPRPATAGGDGAPLAATQQTLGALLEQVQQTARTIDGSMRERLAQLEAANREANDRVKELERLARQTADLEHFSRASEVRLNGGETEATRLLTESTESDEPFSTSNLAERGARTRATWRGAAAGNHESPAGSEGPAWRQSRFLGGEAAGHPRASIENRQDSPMSRAADLRTARVCELVEAGTAPINIAEALDMTLGEVELILNLRNMR